MYVVVSLIEVRTLNNKNFYLLCIVLLINSIASSTTWLVLPVYFKEYGATEVDVGALMATLTIIGALLALPAGRISDRIGRKPILVFSLLGYASSWSIIALARAGASIHWFYISMIARGPFTLLGSAVTAFIADLFEPEKRGSMLGIRQAVGMAGSIIGPVVSGLLIATFSYNGYFLFAASTSLISLFLAFILLKESKADALSIRKYFRKSMNFKIPTLRFPQLHPRTILTENKDLVKFYLARLFAVGQRLYGTILPILYTSIIGLDITEITFMASAHSVLSMVADPILGRFSDKAGRKPILYAGSLISALVPILYTQIHTFNEVFLIRAFSIVATSATMIAGNALLADLVPESHRGLGINLFSFLSSILGSILSIVGGIIVIQYGWSSVLYVAAVISIIGVPILFTVPERKKGIVK